MTMRFRRKKRELRRQQNTVLTCAWCANPIGPDKEVFGFGAKAKPELDLSDSEGTILQLPLDKCRKIIPAMVATSDSQARREGNDLVFMICSRECGMALKEALEDEIEE